MTLIEAVKTGKVENVNTWFIDKDADQIQAEIDKKSNPDWTPLQVAAYGGFTDIASVLLEQGANKDAARDAGATPLWTACFSGSVPVVELLLKAGADKDKAANGSRTPLFVAVHEGHAPVVGLLLDVGANALKYGADDSILKVARDEGDGPDKAISKMLEAHLRDYPTGIMPFDKRPAWAKQLPASSVAARLTGPGYRDESPAAPADEIAPQPDAGAGLR